VNSRTIVPFVIGPVLLLSGAVWAQDRQPDEVTRQLFEQYILRGGKIDTQSVMAATHLVSQRGRETGFWKDVLAELQSDNPHSEIGCVRVLGKMLATDASARDALRRQKEGELSAWIPTVCVGPEVVTVLIDRGSNADRFRIDHYTIALARARAPEAKDFFQSILRKGSVQRDPFTPAAGNPPPLESTQFHAAVGLAQLGDAEGIEWLIENCKFTGAGTVLNAWPQGAPPGGSLSECCLQALRLLSGEHQRTSQAEWAEWWKSADAWLLRNRAVPFGDP
jgi:hypothetical protein